MGDSPTAKPGMLVPARVYASPSLLDQIDQGVFDQVTNVACLPGIVRAALCMPDGHRGTGPGPRQDQLGTLGSGNHYLEIQVIRPEGLHDQAAARALGVNQPGQVCVMLIPIGSIKG